MSDWFIGPEIVGRARTIRTQETRKIRQEIVLLQPYIFDNFFFRLPFILVFIFSGVSPTVDVIDSKSQIF